jgi:hypothetical protein
MNELELSAAFRPIHRHELLDLIGFTAMVPGVPAVSPSQTATVAAAIYRNDSTVMTFIQTTLDGFQDNEVHTNDSSRFTS